MPPAILTEKLTKRYGHRLGIENLDLEVRSGEVFGFIGPIVSALLRRPALAVVIPAVILIAMYVIDGLAQVSKTVAPLRVLSLFYHLGRPLEGDFPWTAVLLMLVGVCALTGAAMGAFARRDIYT